MKNRGSPIEKQRTGSLSSDKQKKRRSAVIKHIEISSSYLEAHFKQSFTRKLKEKNPFPFWHLHSFIDNAEGIVEDIETELQDFPCWNRKENDLYSLYQTKDFKSLSPVDYPALISFRQFIYGKVHEWLQDISGINLLPQVDINGSCYSFTDGLLPHSDQISTRHFAFVYYLTPFIWKQSCGGYLNLYNTNDNNEPTSVAYELPPIRNSLVIFEVSERSWHRVAEVLSDESPRLSINGWFHSDRCLNARVPVPCILPRTYPKGIVNVDDIISSNYLKATEKMEIRKVFGDRSELSLKDFLQKDFYNDVLKQMKKLNFERCGPPNKRLIYRYDCGKIMTDGVLRKLQKMFLSESTLKFICDLTGCDIDGSDCSLTLSRIQKGCYSVLGDEDVEQSIKDGYTLNIHLFFCDSSWIEDSGGEVIYIGKDEEDELVRICPESNCCAIVLCEPEVFSFVKYVNSRARDEFYSLTLTYYHVKVDETEDVESGSS